MQWISGLCSTPHAYPRVERPPLLWEAEVDDVRLVRMLGEMLAAALARGAALDDVVLRASNVTVELSAGDSVPLRGITWRSPSWATPGNGDPM